MTEAPLRPRRVVTVAWDALLDAYRTAALCDEATAPWLDLHCGQIVCAQVSGDAELAQAAAIGRLVRIPAKAPLASLEQRLAFTDTVWDDELRDALAQGLAETNPFVGFHRVLEQDPAEALRWRDDERRTDALALAAWLEAAGYEAVPRPPAARSIIGFPRKAPDEA